MIKKHFTYLIQVLLKVSLPLQLCLIIALNLLPAESTFCAQGTLSNGDMLKGNIIDQSKDDIILEHPNFKPASITAESAMAAAQEGKDDDTESTTLEKPERSFSVVFGGNLTNDDEGEKIGFNSRFNFRYKSVKREASLGLSYIYEIKRSEVDDNNFVATLDHTWLKPEVLWFYFATGRYDYDDFRDWRQRIQSHAGLGYSLISKKNLRFSSKGGAGFRKDFESAEAPFRAEASLGIDLLWNRENGMEFHYQTTYFPALGNDDWRLVSIVDWKIPFVRKSRLSFNTHLEHEYATSPDPGYPPNNLRLTWGLQWQF